ncbi:MAG: hypothetical protein E6G30_03250 [Actinobacteria bacterium]|nr:MAG: hypothetical protein E6G30_03250 [Actinomycetota bacterium]
MPLPPLLADWPRPVQLFLVGSCLWGGLVFGGFILVGHHAIGGADHHLLPDPELLQLVIAAGVGSLLGTLGARTRARRTG